MTAATEEQTREHAAPSGDCEGTKAVKLNKACALGADFKGAHRRHPHAASTARALRLRPGAVA